MQTSINPPRQLIQHNPFIKAILTKIRRDNRDIKVAIVTLPIAGIRTVNQNLLHMNTACGDNRSKFTDYVANVF